MNIETQIVFLEAGAITACLLCAVIIGVVIYALATGRDKYYRDKYYGDKDR